MSNSAVMYDFVMLFRSKLFVATLFLSMLLVAYGPMTMTTQAVDATDSTLQSLKDSALSELNRRIANMTTTLNGLKSDSTFTSSTPVASGQDSLSSTVALSPSLISTTVTSVQGIITQLTGLKTQVQDVSTVGDMQKLATSIDSQFSLDKISNSTGSVTTAISSATSMFDTLKSTFSSVQSQVTKLTTCVNGLGATNAGSSAADCSGVSSNDADKAATAQSQMDGLKTIMSSVGSILMTLLPMILTLVTSLSGVLGSLGSLSNLGDVSNLSSLSSLGSLGSSLSAITSQLGISNGLAGNAQTSLSSITGLMSGFNL